MFLVSFLLCGFIITLFYAIDFATSSEGTYDGPVSPAVAYWLLAVAVWGLEVLRLIVFFVFGKSMYGFVVEMHCYLMYEGFLFTLARTTHVKCVVSGAPRKTWMKEAELLLLYLLLLLVFILGFFLALPPFA